MYHQCCSSSCFVSLFVCLTVVPDARAASSYSSLGCYGDKKGPARALPTRQVYGTDACFLQAFKLGYKIFGLQNGGECWLDNTRANNYNKYGSSDNCKSGLGGVLANSVYRITGDFIIQKSLSLSNLIVLSKV